VNIVAGRLAFQLNGGPPGSFCYFLTTTNLSLPKAAWTRFATNVFDMSGDSTLESAFDSNGVGQTFWTAFIIPSP
jgi:hypothetical protein